MTALSYCLLCKYGNLLCSKLICSCLILLVLQKVANLNRALPNSKNGHFPPGSCTMTHVNINRPGYKVLCDYSRGYKTKPNI